MVLNIYLFICDIMPERAFASIWEHVYMAINS